MNKITLLIIIVFLFIGGSSFAKEHIAKNSARVYLLSLPNYKNLNPDNIKSLKIIRYTEGGVSEKLTKNKIEISEIYNFLKQVVLLGETNFSCTDNTTIYVFELNNNSKISVEIECEWVVIKGKNYKFNIEKFKQ